MARFIRFCGFLLLLVCASTALAAPLLSPWDGAKITVTDVGYACPEIPKISRDLATEGFYKPGDPTHSIVDPVRQAAYNASANPVKNAGLVIVAAADAFRTTGSGQALQCASSHILSLAGQRALTGFMSSNQAYYVQGWVVGAVAIAYLKIRAEASFTAEQQNQIGAWLRDVGRQTRHYYDDRKGSGDGANNHLYWAGLELSAIGISANDASDFGWGIAAYERGVRDIRPDGTLPLELARGSKALHYHLYALAPLVMLAEFGAANRQDLYAKDGGAIHRLVATCVRGLQDPGLFARAVGVKQEIPAHVTGDQIGWAPPYVKRYPSAFLSKKIADAQSLSVFYLGGLPPG